MPMERERRSHAQPEPHKEDRHAEKAPDQPSRETLPGGAPVERPAARFTSPGSSQHHAERNVAQAAEHEDPYSADGPSVESAMGRHETFLDASPVHATMLESTSLSMLMLVDAEPQLTALSLKIAEISAAWDASKPERVGLSLEDDDRLSNQMGDAVGDAVSEALEISARSLADLVLKARMFEHAEIEVGETLVHDVLAMREQALVDQDPLVGLGVQFDSFKAQWDAYFGGPENADGEVQNAEEERLAALSIPLMRRMAEQRAQGLAGLDAKLRVIAHCFEEFDDLTRELKHAETEDMRMMYSIMRDLIEWRDPHNDLAAGRGVAGAAPVSSDAEAEGDHRMLLGEVLAADELAALAPVLLPLIEDLEARWTVLYELHAAGESEAGEQPTRSDTTDARIAWYKRCEEAWTANGYKAGFIQAAAIEEQLEGLADPYLEKPAVTLEGIALKMRLAAVFPYFEDAVKADLTRVQILPSAAPGRRL